jgi:hypothetical protein
MMTINRTKIFYCTKLVTAHGGNASVVQMLGGRFAALLLDFAKRNRRP